MILKNKRPERIESFLICEKVVVDKSKAGNDMFVAIFRDNLNRKFTHYISFNQRSKVWLYNLLFGSGKPIDFESLLMDIEIMHEDPFAYCRGRIYKCIWVFDKKYGLPIINELYDLDKNFLKRDVCTQRYKEGYWRNLCTLHAGHFTSEEDWPGVYYDFEGEENNEKK